MPLAITYRDELGVPLTSAQVDANFHAVEDAIDDLIANPVLPNYPTSITFGADGLTYVHHYTDGLAITVPAPVLTMVIRGEWLPFTLYSPLDTVEVEGVGAFLVRVGHTSGAAFDPALLIDDVPAYRKFAGDPASSSGSVTYDIEFLYEGALADMVRPMNFVALRTILVPSAGAQHRAYIEVPASTAAQALPITHNGVTIGSVTFAISSNAGVVAITADTTILLGDRLSIDLPAAADATAAGMTVGFAAQRVVA